VNALLLALLLAAQAPSDADAFQKAPLAALTAELETLQSGTGAAEVARRIRALGADAPRLVLDAWSRDELPGTSAAVLVLGDEERHALLLSARALGRPAFITP
jgi:hypothetical protein